MTTFYDWVAQALGGAPLAVQLIVILAVVLPLCGIAAGALTRAIDLVATVASRGEKTSGGDHSHGEPGSATQSRQETTAQ